MEHSLQKIQEIEYGEAIVELASREEDAGNCGFLRMGPRLVGEGKLFRKSILYNRDKVELLQQVQNCECSWSSCT